MSNILLFYISRIQILFIAWYIVSIYIVVYICEIPLDVCLFVCLYVCLCWWSKIMSQTRCRDCLKKNRLAENLAIGKKSNQADIHIILLTNKLVISSGYKKLLIFCSIKILSQSNFFISL